MEFPRVVTFDQVMAVPPTEQAHGDVYILGFLNDDGVLVPVQRDFERRYDVMRDEFRPMRMSLVCRVWSRKDWMPKESALDLVLDRLDGTKLLVAWAEVPPP
jgi:hypothetical protein